MKAVCGQYRQDPELEAGLQEGRHGHPGQLFVISDGAAAMVLMRASQAESSACKPIARIVGHTTHAGSASPVPTAPVGAMQKLLAKTGWTAADVDLWEINEAFAVGHHGRDARHAVAGTRRSTSTAAPARWATRSAPPVPASSSRCLAR
jgi:hypothetical protein